MFRKMSECKVMLGNVISYEGNKVDIISDGLPSKTCIKINGQIIEGVQRLVREIDIEKPYNKLTIVTCDV